MLKVAEEQLEAATGVAVNAEVLHEHIAAICTHVQPSPLVAYGLLFGLAPREVVGKSLLPKVHMWMHILLGLPSVADGGARDIEGLIKEHVALRLHLQRRKRGRQDLQLEGGVVTLSKSSRKVGEREQTKRDRQHLLSAIHAVRTKVAFKNVADSLRSAVEILEHLDPEFHGTHVFADLGHRTTITHACLIVADALDSWLSGKSELNEVRPSSNILWGTCSFFSTSHVCQCVSSLSIHSRDTFFLRNFHVCLFFTSPIIQPRDV